MTYQYYFEVLKKYATFTGRARRSEYWYYSLFSFLATILAIAADNLMGTTIGILPYGFVYFAYVIAVFLPGLAVVVRRFHDVGKSGWMMFIVLIPLVGIFWLIVLLCTDSQPGENQYGENPKGIGNSGNEDELINQIGQ